MPSADGRRTCCLQKKPMSWGDKDPYDTFWIMNPLCSEVWLVWTSQHLLQNIHPPPHFPPPAPSKVSTELLTLLSAQQFASKTNANYQCRHCLMIWHYMAQKCTSVLCCVSERCISSSVPARLFLMLWSHLSTLFIEMWRGYCYISDTPKIVLYNLFTDSKQSHIKIDGL